MSVVGFDFGNINCTIAAAQKGGVDVLLNETSSRQTAAMVGFGEKERYLGEGANAQYMRNIKNTITDIKRLLGRKWSDKELQQEIAKLPFRCVELPNQEVGVEVFYAGEQKVFSLVSITAMLLQKLKLTAEAALAGRSCKDVVISVPGWWMESQRRALLNAASIANLNCLRLINDNTATALGYGIYKTNLSDTVPTHVMFVDMGQSSTSVSVVEFLKGKLRVISSVYDRNLGGRNFDDVLVDHFAEEFKGKFKVDIKSNTRALIRLRVACERLKKMLNTNPEAPINIDSIMDDKDVHGMMQREKFEGMCKSLVERVQSVAQQALTESGIEKDKLFALEIVGGASRLRVVKEGLTTFFGKEVSQTLNAEEAVARGCALQCAMLSPLFRVREFSIADIYAYPVKVSWKNSGTDSVGPDDSVEILIRNNPVPSSKMITFHRSEPLELIAEYAQPQLLPPGTPTFIGKWTVPSIPHKEGEQAKLRANVKLDLHSSIRLESVQSVETIEEEPAAAADKKDEVTPMEQEPTTPPASPAEQPKAEAAPANGDKKEEAKKEEAKKKKVRRTDLSFSGSTVGSLTDKQLQDLAEEEAKMSAADRLAIETAEQKNAVESYVYDMRSKINDALATYATEEGRNKFSKLLEDTESWLYGEGEDVQKSVYTKKLEELKALGDPIVKRKFEDENRYEAILQLQNTIQNYKLTAESEDPKYEHIEKEEKQKVIDEAKKIETWLNTEMGKQDKLPKHVDPAITIAEVNRKKQELERFSNPILNKPKPKPKVEEPKKEAEAQPAPSEPKPADQPKPETQAGNKPPGDKPAEPNVEMDLD